MPRINEDALLKFLQLFRSGAWQISCVKVSSFTLLRLQRQLLVAIGILK
jgi:hypothetical protein